MEVVRLNDKLFICLLNKVRVGNINDNVEKLLKEKLMHESDENYPRYSLHMYSENKSAVKINEAVLNDLHGDLYTVEANDKIPDSCKYPLATVKGTPKTTNTEGLSKLVKLKISAKVMLTVNLDIQGRLINDQTGKISFTEFVQGSLWKVYVKISNKQTCSKAIRSSYLVRQYSWAPIEKCEAEIPIKKGSASPFIEHTQFPSTLTRTFTVDKVQGLNLEYGVGNFDFQQ